MFYKLIFSFLFIVGCSIGWAQSQIHETFLDYEILTIDSKLQMEKTKTGFFETEFIVPQRNLNWTLDLKVSNIISDNYVLKIYDEDKITFREGTTAIPTQGYIKGNPNSRVSLTFNEGFIYGFIQEGDETYYVEPLIHFDKSAAKDVYIFYHENDQKPHAEKTCGTDHKKHRVKTNEETIERGSRVGECFEVEWAIASDFLMFDQYGSVAAVENHAIGVTNNVQTNYDDEFADEIQFVIPGQVVISSSGQDPWTSSTNAGTLLDDFTDWGPSGFGFAHDVGSLWTARDFSGSTIGIAWLGVVCTNARYNCLEDFTSSASFKRVLVSHELGHNFDASHDASGSNTIMAPSVNSSTSWSSASISSINDHIASRFCLSACTGGGGNPPIADFDFNQSSDCAPTDIQFFDNSTGSNLSYEWNVPGGNPSFSTQQNPIIFFPQGGEYSVSLTVSNGNGEDTHVVHGIIFSEEPVADFDYNIDGSTVDFTNFSIGAEFVSWNFGDGNWSTEDNPTHTYSDDGSYFVNLFVSNSCGDSELEVLINIATPPTADFDYSQTVICEGDEILFTNTSSSNTQFVEWEFEGGSPVSTTVQNPTINYFDSGIFDVTLIAQNLQGQSVKTLVDIIEVIEPPTADFTYSIEGSSVIFTNQSESASLFYWDFGDGNSSNAINPTHTYSSSGEYTVVLTAMGNSVCEDHVFSADIVLSLAPSASFEVAGTSSASGCAPLVVQYNNTSLGSSNSYSWSFEGGTPSSSTEVNPTVTYHNTGVFDVELVAENANGSNTSLLQDLIAVSSTPGTASIEEMIDGLSFVFSGSAENATTYHWDFGDDNTGSGSTIDHEYDTDGTYPVTLTASNGCGESTVSQTVQAYSEVTASFTQNTNTICKGEKIQFTNLSSSNADTYQWTFEGGIPSTSTIENPEITYNEAGTYDVSLTVSNPLYSDDVIMTNSITVVENLSPNFTMESTGLTVTFQGSSMTSEVSWDFGDGTTSTEQNPSHTYSSEGIYEITYTVTNACGSFTDTKTVNLYTQVTAAIAPNFSGGCAPHTIEFIDNSSDNTTAWEWTFEGATTMTSTEQNPSATWNSAGTYTVTLMASNPVSMQSTSVTVVISDIADVSFEEFREELVVSFTNTSTGGGDSFAWDFGDGNTSTEENPTHSYAVEGQYDVSLSVTNECDTSTETRSITASALPSASYSISETSGCLPFTVDFTDQSSSNVSAWAWTFEGGNPSTSTEQNPTVTYNNVGTYDVSLTVTASSGSDQKTDVDAITVIDVPTDNFNFTIEGSIVEFLYEYEADLTWDFGDGKTSTEHNPTHVYDEDGSYKVILNASNECGTTVIEREIVISTVSTSDIEDLKFNVYPNPATDYFTIESNVSLLDVTILSITGQKIVKHTIKSQDRIHTSNLLDGTYFIKIETKDNRVGYQKLIIMR